jgi:hypothetical protein
MQKGIIPDATNAMVPTIIGASFGFKTSDFEKKRKKKKKVEKISSPFHVLNIQRIPTQDQGLQNAIEKIL